MDDIKHSILIKPFLLNNVKWLALKNQNAA